MAVRQCSELGPHPESIFTAVEQASRGHPHHAAALAVVNRLCNREPHFPAFKGSKQVLPGALWQKALYVQQPALVSQGICSTGCPESAATAGKHKTRTLAGRSPPAALAAARRIPSAVKMVIWVSSVIFALPEGLALIPDAAPPVAPFNFRMAQGTPPAQRASLTADQATPEIPSFLFMPGIHPRLAFLTKVIPPPILRVTLSWPAFSSSPGQSLGPVSSSWLLR